MQNFDISIETRIRLLAQALTSIYILISTELIIWIRIVCLLIKLMMFTAIISRIPIGNSFLIFILKILDKFVMFFQICHRLPCYIIATIAIIHPFDLIVCAACFIGFAIQDAGFYLIFFRGGRLRAHVHCAVLFLFVICCDFSIYHYIYTW